MKSESVSSPSPMALPSGTSVCCVESVENNDVQCLSSLAALRKQIREDLDALLRQIQKAFADQTLHFELTFSGQPHRNLDQPLATVRSSSSGRARNRSKAKMQVKADASPPQDGFPVNDNSLFDGTIKLGEEDALKTAPLRRVASLGPRSTSHVEKSETRPLVSRNDLGVSKFQNIRNLTAAGGDAGLQTTSPRPPCAVLEAWEETEIVASTSEVNVRDDEMPTAKANPRLSARSSVSSLPKHTRFRRMVRIDSTDSEDKAAKHKEALKKQMVEMIEEDEKGYFASIRARLPHRCPETPLARFLNHKNFSTCIMCLIMSMTVFLGIDANISMSGALRKPGSKPPQWLRVVDLMFSSAFTLEMLLKIVGLRTWYIVGPDWKWNCFDAFLVVTSWLSEFLTTLASGADLGVLRVLRVFRMVRILRVIRVLAFVQELRKMLICIGNAMLALGWAFLLLFMFMYVFSIIFLDGAAKWVEEDYLKCEGDATCEETLTDLRTWFPNVFDGIFSMWLAISGGMDWYDIQKPLMSMPQPYGYLYQYLFLFFIVFVVFGVLNVLTGVFVSAASEILDKDLIVQAEVKKLESFYRDMNHLFETLDTNNAGKVSWEEWQLVIADERTQAYLASYQLNVDDAHLLFKLLADENNTITQEDFIMGAARLKGPARSAYVLTLVKETAELSKKVDILTIGLEEQFEYMYAALGLEDELSHSTTSS